MIYAVDMHTVGRWDNTEKNVTAVTSSPRSRGRIKEAKIRAKYAKFTYMKSCDFWCIEWMILDLIWVHIMGS